MTAVASCSASSLCTMPTPIASQASQSLSAPSADEKHTFALAQIKGDVCLVQVPHSHSFAFAQGGMASALMAADVHVFRHEFITLFRYSHRATVHPADMHILEPIDDALTLYEEDKGTVFLARDVMARLQKHAMAARRTAAMSVSVSMAAQRRYHQHHLQHHQHFHQHARHGHSLSLPVSSAHVSS